MSLSSRDSSASESLERQAMHELLGVGPNEAVTHYSLLRLGADEQNLDVIERAADRQMSFLRTEQQNRKFGPALVAALLNKISTARIVLLDPAKKRDYDAGLLAQAVPPVAHAVPASPVHAVPVQAAAPPRVAQRPAVAPPPPAGPPSLPMPAAASTVSSVARPQGVPVDASDELPRIVREEPRKRAGGRNAGERRGPVGGWAKNPIALYAAGGGAVVVILLLLAVWLMSGNQRSANETARGESAKDGDSQESGKTDSAETRVVIRKKSSGPESSRGNTDPSSSKSTPIASNLPDGKNPPPPKSSPERKDSPKTPFRLKPPFGIKNPFGRGDRPSSARPGTSAKGAKEEAKPAAGSSLEPFTWYRVLGDLEVPRDVVEGDWTQDSKSKELEVAARGNARVALPWVVKSHDFEIELEIDFQLIDGSDWFEVALPFRKGATLVVNGKATAGGFTGLDFVDKVRVWDDPKAFRGHVLSKRKHSVQVSCKAEGPDAFVSLTVDGNLVFDWKGQTAQLAADPAFGVPPGKIGFGTIQSRARIEDIRLRVSAGDVER